MLYQIEYSKKDNGWITKYETKTYKYLRISNSPAHSTIEDAENWIKEYDTDHPWIDHKIDGYKGHLMPLQEWKECCDEGGFIDYDGYGNAVDENYSIIQITDTNDYEGDHVWPSDYTKLGGKKIPIDTKYILWYNR
jgi:hypothetical protein